ncbi:EI24 domain-containing protein [Microbacterium sp. YY-03]|uniref:EI24 domain-containing protein n=1 Tax=Microbacterium sp. YY-03 TaxID=3421636 RepID=UPI003D1650CA
MRDFIRGVRDFLGSFAWFRRTPKQMRNALISAVLVWLLLAAAVITFAVFLPTIIIAITPFADEWNPAWATIFRVGAALGMLAAVLYLATRVYRSLTVIVAEHSYVRLRRAVAAHASSSLEPQRVKVSSQVGNTLFDLVTGLPLAIVVFLLSLIPIVGVVLSWTVAAVMSGREFGEELIKPSLTDETVMKENRSRIAGFGIAANLTILIPFVGMLAMPVAVAGATALATKIAPHGN